MRLEVYQQASGNRHEPNYSDDTTKMFSLNDIDEIIEKVSEQKPVDKVKPKFKVGNWVMLDRPVLITKVEDTPYNTHQYWTSDGTWFGDTTKAKLWTIEDAKPGDILATLNYIIFFKKFLKNNGGISYCHYDFGAGNPQFIWSEDKNWYFGKETIIHPATKEQHDLLFSKMKEAGYEWDAEKKELKTIEEKPVDKVEPKFHEGDWIITPKNKVLQITSIEGTNYRFNNESHYWEICYCGEQCRLWTIQDAKDGDVLSYRDSQWIFIYKDKIDNSSFYYYALYSTIHQDLTINDSGFTLLSDAIVPATKEQLDTLMKAMNDAGYTFDFEKKELKKIEQKPVEWSEEDDILLNDTIYTIKEGERFENELKHENCHDSHTYQVIISWLKSLKERVQPQQEWKPSDEQIKAIKWVIDGDNPENWSITLKNLYQDLKKLKG